MDIFFKVFNDVMYTPLQFVLLESKDDKKFKTSEDLYELCKYLLKNGSKANFRQSLLAEAINFCSIDLCRLLLEHGANPKSEFDRQIPDSSVYQKCRLNLCSAKETALHAAYRIGSEAKIKLFYNTERVKICAAGMVIHLQKSWKNIKLTTKFFTL